MYEAEDSRQQQKPKSPLSGDQGVYMVVPHRGFDAAAVSYTFLRDLEKAVQHILSLLYLGQPPPPAPLNNKTQKHVERNEAIRTRFANGETVQELSAAFNISPQRISQIIQGKRK